MPLERSILVGVKNSGYESALKKLIVRMGCRGRWVKTAEECHSVMESHSSFCTFFDRDFFKTIHQPIRVSLPTYLVLMVDPRDVGHAIRLQAKGEIHDWVSMPMDASVGVSLLAKARLHTRQATELRYIKEAASDTIRSDATLLCTGKWADDAKHWIDRVKDSNDPILLIGEPGSGKGLIGQLIHCSSSRESGAFVIVKCNGENAEAAEREIFGLIPSKNHGTHTTSSPSQLALAAHGTLFFHKVEKLPRRLQQRLARVIQTRRFSPIGSGEAVPLDARLIFSVQSENGTPLHCILQPDLAKLLKRHALHIPPLRERQDDFPLIVKNVLEKLRKDRGVRPAGISAGALEALNKHPWDGNIRELEGLLWAAALLAGSSNISLKHVTPFLSNGAHALPDEEKALDEVVSDRIGAFFRKFPVDQLENLHPMFISRVEKTLIENVLLKTDGCQVQAAKVLGINRNTLRRKMQDFKLGAA